jgi:hypothetical protein
MSGMFETSLLWLFRDTASMSMYREGTEVVADEDVEEETKGWQ